MHGEENEDAERVFVMSVECPAPREKTCFLMRDLIP